MEDAFEALALAPAAVAAVWHAEQVATALVELTDEFMPGVSSNRGMETSSPQTEEFLTA